jgi:hypothetical protein
MKSLIRSAFVAASLLLIANAAMAADTSAQDAINAANAQQAAQEQNDEANAAFNAAIAAAEQTEINANNQ